jgi:hypothetical protein
LSDEERQQALLAGILWRDLLEQDERDACAADPKMLLRRMAAVDERQAEPFRFLQEEGWEWQGEFFDWLHTENRCIALKARQLGVTWLGCAYVLWVALYKQGSLSLVYRQKEEEAHENVGRCWDLLNSLPSHLWNGAVVKKPDRGARATGEIALAFPDGRRSRILAMTSASASGHGKTAACIMLDEFSRIDRASDIMKAVQPAAGKQGKIHIISTANGVANPETGEGNYFNYLWVNAEQSGFAKKFLGWYEHPDRDQDWYDHDPEVRGLRDYERAEQYPSNEHEAFALTTNNYFDQAEIAWYGGRVPETLYRCEFERVSAREARIRKRDNGYIRVYREPETGVKYAIGADVAGETGVDFSAACVVNLSNMEIAAEFYDKIDPDLYAFQLHYLGKWFNTAHIAVENQGGWGNAVIVPLRDGREGRPAYPSLYKHVLSNRPDLPTAKPFGFPMGENNRPNVINQLGRAVREGTIMKGAAGLPYMTSILLDEAKTFIRSNPLGSGGSQRGPWPRAQNGAKDDMVMATCIALELYRLKGEWPDRQRKQPKSRFKHWLPINQAA